jgi:gamma-glutamyltranspeptidase/glutathione hydrolase
MEDLASHKSEWVEPVSTNYRGFDVWEIPPNGQGIAALQMLNILEQYNIKEMGFGSVEYLHTLIESKK